MRSCEARWLSQSLLLGYLCLFMVVLWILSRRSAVYVALCMCI